MLTQRSSIPIKNAKEIESMRKASSIAACVLERLCELAEPGVTTHDLDRIGKKLIEDAGAESACYNYSVNNRSFPAYTCLSVNDEVVHGIGSMDRKLRAGDNISIDVVVHHKGFIGDNAATVLVGDDADAESARLLQVAKQAMHKGIEQAQEGSQVGDISHAIQTYVEDHGFYIVREFVGHGVGRSMHEEPQIPNFGPPSSGPYLKSGMTLAIEPMVLAADSAICIDPDGWTARTRNRCLAAHFEHTILVTEGYPEILTKK